MTNAQTLTHQLLMRKFLNQLDLMLLEMIAEQKFQRQRDLIQLMRLINPMYQHLQGLILLVMILDQIFQRLRDLMPLMRQMFHHQRLDQVMTLNLTHQPHLL